MAQEKPKPATGFEIERLPQEMIDAPRWVNWKAVYREDRGGWTKVPIETATLRPASTVDPSTWGTFAAAVAAATDDHELGIGFVFGDGWLGMDFDHVDTDAELAGWLNGWMDRHPTAYLESSPSGTGLHAIMRAAKPAWSQNRRGGVELYERARFFTVTGKAFRETASMEGQQPAVDEVADRWLRSETASSSPRPSAAPPAPAGVSVSDPSAADWAFCNDLAARGFREQEIAARLREKMQGEGRHEKARRDDYVIGTARKALATSKPADAIVEALEVKGLGSIVSANPVKTPYIVSRLLRRGEVAALIAPPKCRKSFLVADLAVSGATGSEWFGQYPVTKGRVLLVDNELSENEIADRMRAILSEKGVAIEDIAALEVMSLRTSDAGIDQVIADLIAREQGYDLIIFDALYMFLEEGMDENSNADMTVLLRKFRRLAGRTGAAVVLVHHTSKGVQAGKEAIDLGAGAGALGRAVDTNIAIFRHAEEGYFVMRFNVRSSAPIGDLGIKWSYPVFSSVLHGLDLEDLHTGRKAKKSD